MPPIDPTRLDGFHPQLASSASRPVKLMLDSTNRCNLRCIMCYFAYDDAWEVPLERWPRDFVDRLEREVLPYTKHAQLSLGTEPLVWRHFPDLLDACRRAGVPIIDMYTNGLLLDAALARKIVATPMTRVQLSLEGTGERGYDDVRVGGDFDRFVRAVELLVAARDAAGSPLPRLQFNITLLRRNAGQVEDILRLAHRLGVDYIDIRHLIIHGGLAVDDDSFLHDKGGYNRLMRRVRSLAATLGLEISAQPDDFDLGEHAASREASTPAPPPVVLGGTLPARDDAPLAMIGRWAFECVEHAVPDRLAPGEACHAAVTLRNRGDVAWSSSASAGWGDYKRVGDVVLAVALDGERTASVKLPRETVGPGETVRVEFPIVARADPGAQELRLDLLRWEIAAFSECGTDPLRIRIDVEGDASARPPACRLPWEQFMVRPDRTVAPCTFWYTTDHMGSLEERSFLEIWNGPEYRRLRRELLSDKPGVNCRACPLRGIGHVDDDHAHYSFVREKADLASSERLPDAGRVNRADDDRRRLAGFGRFDDASVEAHAQRVLGTMLLDDVVRGELDRRLDEGWDHHAAVKDVAHRAIARMLDVALERVGPGASILDFGCGEGSLANFGRDYSSLAHPVVAVDRVIPRTTFPANATFAHADLHEFEWTGDPFDLALSLHVFEQVPDPPRLAARLRGLLRAGGIALLAVPDAMSAHTLLKWIWHGDRFDEVNSFTFESFDRTITNAGFKRIAWMRWPASFEYHYGHVQLPGHPDLGELLARFTADFDRAHGNVAGSYYGYAFAYEAI